MSTFSNPASAAREARAAYTKALLELLGDRDPLQILADLPSTLAGAIDGLSDGACETAEGPGKWSIRDVVQHLADHEIVFGHRLRTVLACDGAPLTGYDQDLWARRFHYDEVKTANALEQMRILRSANLRLVKSLEGADLDRAGIHEERGPESMIQMIRLEAAHGLVHLRQINRIRAAVERDRTERTM